MERVLTLARTHLDLDVAWFSQFANEKQVLEHVSGDSDPFGISPGFSASYEESYCSRVLTGELPNIVADAQADERTRDLQITETLGIGAYVGVPVVLPSGEVYGMMCCIGREAHAGIDDRDLKFIRLLADVLSDDVQRRKPMEDERVATRERVQAAIAGEGLTVVFQPIVQLMTGDVVGVESLSRFHGGPATPDQWFAEAAAVGLGTELELASMRLAVGALPQLPDHLYLSINASPDLIIAWADRELPDGVPYARLVVEITEHAAIENYDRLDASLCRLRARGVRIAIDDAGAGYATFRHVLRVRPDIIKLDISITRQVDADPARRALAAAFLSLATELGATLVAEGVETVAERAALQALGVTTGQGYLFARPGPLGSVSATKGRRPAEPAASSPGRRRRSASVPAPAL